MLTSHRRFATAAAPLVIAAALLSGCSDAGNEQAIEQAIEDANPSIDADVSDGGGGVRATDDEGNEISAGSQAEVPADFPSVVPLPTGLTLITAGSSADGEFTLSYTVTGDTGAAISTYGAELAGAGFTLDDSATAAGVNALMARGNGYDVMVLGTPASLTVNVAPQ